MLDVFLNQIKVSLFGNCSIQASSIRLESFCMFVCKSMHDYIINQAGHV